MFLHFCKQAYMLLLFCFEYTHPPKIKIPIDKNTTGVGKHFLNNIRLAKLHIDFIFIYSKSFLLLTTSKTSCLYVGHNKMYYIFIFYAEHREVRIKYGDTHVS